MCCRIELKKIAARPAAVLSGLAVLLLFLLSMEKDMKGTGVSLEAVVSRSVAEEFADGLYESFLPAYAFVREKSLEDGWFAYQQIVNIMPLYGYSREQEDRQPEGEYISLDEILLAEAREGERGSEQEAPTASAEEDNLEELLLEENEAAAIAEESSPSAPIAFVPHSVQAPVNLEELKDYEKLVKEFYAIDANTMAGSERLDVTKLLAEDMRLEEAGEGPQILIYHTHSQEAYTDSVEGDDSTTIMGMGAWLAQILTEEYGYQVLHHTGKYDVETRDDAYSKSLPAIEQLLEENPSIRVIIDLHRDQMPPERRLTVNLDGRPTAQFMFFNGLSHTRKTGDISYLYNENLDENLAFSFQMQLKAMEYYPGLTRKIYLKGYRYNMHLMPRTLLVELGAQNNTVEEARNACEPLAHLLDMVLR